MKVLAYQFNRIIVSSFIIFASSLLILPLGSADISPLTPKDSAENSPEISPKDINPTEKNEKELPSGSIKKEEDEILTDTRGSDMIKTLNSSDAHMASSQLLYQPIRMALRTVNDTLHEARAEHASMVHVAKVQLSGTLVSLENKMADETQALREIRESINERKEKLKADLEQAKEVAEQTKQAVKEAFHAAENSIHDRRRPAKIGLLEAQMTLVEAKKNLEASEGSGLSPEALAALKAAVEAAKMGFADAKLNAKNIFEQTGSELLQAKAALAAGFKTAHDALSSAHDVFENGMVRPKNELTQAMEQFHMQQVERKNKREEAERLFKEARLQSKNRLSEVHTQIDELKKEAHAKWNDANRNFQLDSLDLKKRLLEGILNRQDFIAAKIALKENLIHNVQMIADSTIVKLGNI